jgi:outer membrane receptor protein involved in Fe transport
MARVPVAGVLFSCAFLAQANAQEAEGEAVVVDMGLNRPSSGGGVSPSLPLDQALSSISLQWGVSFIFDSRIVDGKFLSRAATESPAFSEDDLATRLRAIELGLYHINERTFAIRAYAPSATAVSRTADAASASPAPLVDMILVTGSRIPTISAIPANPITTLRGVEFDIRGTTRVEDLTNTLPQVFAAAGANTSNGATGTAEVSLRGLGASRTLVLVNGHRLQYGSPTSSAPDLNQIPGALVERIEVLTGGASATYGSDAIAGVVNFIMMTDFDGVRIDGQVSGYQHSNDNFGAQRALLNAFPAPGSDYTIPEAGVFDGRGQDLTLIIGTSSEDGRGNVTIYAGYRTNDAILQADRDYSKCGYGGGDPVFFCAGSSTTPNGRFFTNTGDYTLDENGPGNTLRPRTVHDTFNYAPTNFYQRPDERFTLGAFGHYQVSEELELYSEAMFNDYQSDAQIAHSGTFFATSRVNCDNPLLDTPGSGWLTALGCTAEDVAAGRDVSLVAGKRFIESGPRNDAIRLTSYRMLSGVRGSLSSSWDFDAYFQYGVTSNSHIVENYVVTKNVQNALLAVDDGAGGVQCRDVVARAEGCVPLNLFEIGGVDRRQLDYILRLAFRGGETGQYLGEIVISGELDAYGVRSPWADESPSIVFGAQWRKDKSAFKPDSLLESGLLADQVGPSPPISGEIENTDLFVETRLPLVSGMEFVDQLTIHGYYRISDVSTAGSYSTWKIAGDWRIAPELRVRGGWQRSIRAPNVIELFTPQSGGTTVLPSLANDQGDPCAGDLVFTDEDSDGVDDVGAPIRTLDECMRTGVSAAQYGAIIDNPAGEYNAVFGGNRDLDAEKSNTYTIGFVFASDDYAPGHLAFSADYFDISVEDFISTISPETMLNQCLETGDPYFCSSIHRDASGTLWLTPSAFIVATNANTGLLSTSGVDVNLNWDFDLEEVGLGYAGGVEMDFVGTYVYDLKTRELPNNSIEEYDCAGYYAGRCGGPNPRWRHRMRATWRTPINIDATLTWRHFSSVNRGDSVQGFAAARQDRDFALESRNYIDLQASYNVTENWNVRIGVNNLLDKDPPLTSQTAGFANGNTFPQTYDAMGRFLFLGATIDF